MEAVTVQRAERSGLRRYVSVLEGIRPYQWGWLQTDIIAGSPWRQSRVQRRSRG